MPTIDDLCGLLRELREENRTAHEAINGRLRQAEVDITANKTEICNLKEDVKTLSVLDKGLAVVGSVLAAVIGLWGKP